MFGHVLQSFLGNLLECKRQLWRHGFLHGGNEDNLECLFGRNFLAEPSKGGCQAQVLEQGWIRSVRNLFRMSVISSICLESLSMRGDGRGSLGLDVGQLKFCEDKLLLYVIVQLTRDPLAFVILGFAHFRFAVPQRPRGLFYSLNRAKSATKGTAITELDI